MNTQFTMNRRTNQARRGVVVPLLGFMLVTLIGTIAFVADVGHLVVVRTTLGAAADAAALAGAGAMAQSYNLNVVEETAINYGQANVPINYGTVLDGTSVLLGEWNPETRVFHETNVNPNAVKVVVERKETRGNAVPYFFAKVFGMDTTDVTVEAIAAGANNTSDQLPSSTYTVYVTSSKDLSNVVLQFADGSPDLKYESISGYSMTFTSDKPISGVWIKSGCNTSGDGPGYGEYIGRPDPYDGTTLHGNNKHQGCTPHVTATFQAAGAEFTSSGTATPVRLVR